MREQTNNRIKTLLNVLHATSRWVSGVSLVVMTLIIGWQVYARFVLNNSPSWSEGSALLLMSWFILLGAAAGIRYGDHLGFTVGLVLAPPPLRRLMRCLTFTLMVLFGALMAWYGTALVQGTWAGNMPGMILPQGVDYIPLVVGGILIAIFSLEKLIQVASDPEALEF